MTTTRVCTFAIVVAATLAGCRGTREVGYSGEVRVTSPQLVVISPGVQVLADADEPIFYVTGSYWLYRDGYWFSSATYRSGYARVDFASVPPELRVIAQPERYAHYQRNIGTYQARTPQTRTRSPQPPYPRTVEPPPPAEPYPSPTFPTEQPTSLPPPPVPPEKPADPTDTPPARPDPQPSELSPEKPTTPAGADAPAQTPSQPVTAPPTRTPPTLTPRQKELSPND